MPAPAAAAAPASDKLRTAWRNRGRWGLAVVDLRWALDSAAAGRRLDEAAYALAPPPGLEQVAPNAAAAPAVSGCSDGAADTACGLPPATLVAAAARSARPPDPLRASLNSRPLRDFGGPAAAPSLQSLQTQGPSARRSVRWAPSLSDGSSEAAAAAAAVLPATVERPAQHSDEGACELQGRSGVLHWPLCPTVDTPSSAPSPQAQMAAPRRRQTIASCL